MSLSRLRALAGPAPAPAAATAQTAAAEKQIEITTDFRKAAEKEDYIATDGLHPSAKVYGKWAKKLAAAVSKIAKK